MLLQEGGVAGGKASRINLDDFRISDLVYGITPPLKSFSKYFHESASRPITAILSTLFAVLNIYRLVYFSNFMNADFGIAKVADNVN